jgi:hypothetical protein
VNECIQHRTGEMIYHYTIGHICVNENSVYAQVLPEVIAAARA